MNLEAAFWVALSVTAPWAWPRLRRRLGPWVDPFHPLALWAHAILPAYVALVRGAVLGRDLGLYGPDVGQFAAGLLACAAGLGVAFAARRWLSPTAGSPLTALQEEPRWALYRAAGILWLGGLIPGIALGLGLAALEVGLAAGWWKAEARSRPTSWLPLLRAGFSAALFFVTRSFWLTAATQAGVLALLSGAGGKKVETRGA